MNPKSPKTTHRADANGFIRTRDDHQRELAEDYVELIDELTRQRGEARSVESAGR